MTFLYGLRFPLLFPRFRVYQGGRINVNTHDVMCSRGGGGGGHSGTEGGRTFVAYFAEEGSFLRPPHVRDFVKQGYFFVPRYEVWGSESPYNPRNIRSS